MLRKIINALFTIMAITASLLVEAAQRPLPPTPPARPSLLSKLPQAPAAPTATPTARRAPPAPPVGVAPFRVPQKALPLAPYSGGAQPTVPTSGGVSLSAIKNTAPLNPTRTLFKIGSPEATAAARAGNINLSEGTVKTPAVASKALPATPPSISGISKPVVVTNQAQQQRLEQARKAAEKARIDAEAAAAKKSSIKTVKPLPTAATPAKTGLLSSAFSKISSPFRKKTTK